jgi:hypothetical protein
MENGDPQIAVDNLRRYFDQRFSLAGDSSVLVLSYWFSVLTSTFKAIPPACFITTCPAALPE